MDPHTPIGRTVCPCAVTGGGLYVVTRRDAAHIASAPDSVGDSYSSSEIADGY